MKIYLVLPYQAASRVHEQTVAVADAILAQNYDLRDSLKILNLLVRELNFRLIHNQLNPNDEVVSVPAMEPCRELREPSYLHAARGSTGSQFNQEIRLIKLRFIPRRSRGFSSCKFFPAVRTTGSRSCGPG